MIIKKGEWVRSDFGTKNRDKVKKALQFCELILWDGGMRQKALPTQGWNGPLPIYNPLFSTNVPLLKPINLPLKKKKTKAMEKEGGV